MTIINQTQPAQRSRAWSMLEQVASRPEPEAAKSPADMLLAAASRPEPEAVPPAAPDPNYWTQFTEAAQSGQLDSMKVATIGHLFAAPDTKIGGADAYDNLAALNIASQQYKPTRGEQQMATAQGFGETAMAYLTNPAAVGRQAVKSLVPVVEIGGVPAAIGGIVGGAIGSVVPVAGTAAGAAIGTAIGTGGGSAVISGALKVLDLMEAQGIDTTNPAAIKAARNDPAVWGPIAQQASLYGIGVGLFDAASAGAASKLSQMARGATVGVARGGGIGSGIARSSLVRGGVESLTDKTVQGLMGAGGEVAGGEIAGTPYNWNDVLGEFTGEFAGAPLEHAMPRQAAHAAQGLMNAMGMNAPPATTPPTPGGTTPQTPTSPAQSTGQTSSASATEGPAQQTPPPSPQTASAAPEQTPSPDGQGSSPTVDPEEQQIIDTLNEVMDLGRQDGQAGTEPHQFEGLPSAVQRAYDRAYREGKRQQASTGEGQDQGQPVDQMPPEALQSEAQPTGEVSTQPEPPALADATEIPQTTQQAQSSPIVPNPTPGGKLPGNTTQEPSNGQETQGQEEGLLSPAVTAAPAGAEQAPAGKAGKVSTVDAKNHPSRMTFNEYVQAVTDPETDATASETAQATSMRDAPKLPENPTEIARVGAVRIMQGKTDRQFVAMDGEKVVGFINGSHTGNTTSMLVSDSHSGQGIGAELAWQLRSRHPMQKSGGLSSGGKATLRKVWERFNAPTPHSTIAQSTPNTAGASSPSERGAGDAVNAKGGATAPEPSATVSPQTGRTGSQPRSPQLDTLSARGTEGTRIATKQEAVDAWNANQDKEFAGLRADLETKDDAGLAESLSFWEGEATRKGVKVAPKAVTQPAASPESNTPAQPPASLPATPTQSEPLSSSKAQNPSPTVARSPQLSALADRGIEGTRIATEIEGLVSNGTLRQETANLAAEMLSGYPEAQLATRGFDSGQPVKVVIDPKTGKEKKLSRVAQTNIRDKRNIITFIEGLATKYNPTADPDQTDAAVMLEELAHAGFHAILTENQRAEVQKVYEQDKADRKTKAALDNSGLSDTKEGVAYGYSNVDEFFARRFVEHVFGGKAVEPGIINAIKGFAKRLSDAIGRITGRSTATEMALHRLRPYLDAVATGQPMPETAAPKGWQKNWTRAGLERIVMADTAGMYETADEMRMRLEDSTDQEFGTGYKTVRGKDSNEVDAKTGKRVKRKGRQRAPGELEGLTLQQRKLLQKNGTGASAEETARAYGTDAYNELLDKMSKSGLSQALEVAREADEQGGRASLAAYLWDQYDPRHIITKDGELTYPLMKTIEPMNPDTIPDGSTLSILGVPGTVNVQGSAAYFQPEGSNKQLLMSSWEHVGVTKDSLKLGEGKTAQGSRRDNSRTEEEIPFGRDVPGQFGLFNNRDVSPMSGAQGSLFDTSKQAETKPADGTAPNATEPQREGESNADYRLRLKSAEAEKATGRLFGREVPGEDASAKNAQIWYSKLSEVVTTKMGGAMDAAQLRAMLQNNGVKPEEMEWSKVGELTGKVTKQQVHGFDITPAMRQEATSKGMQLFGRELPGEQPDEPKISTKTRNTINRETGVNPSRDAVTVDPAKALAKGLKATERATSAAFKEGQATPKITAETIKARIKRLTGVTDSSGAVDTTKAERIAEMFKTQEQAARRAWASGQRAQRASDLLEMDVIRNKFKQKDAKARDIRDQMKNLINRSLQPADRGRFIGMVARARSFSELMKAHSLISRVMYTRQGRDLKDRITNLLKSSKLKDLTNARRDDIRTIAAGIQAEITLFDRAGPVPPIVKIAAAIPKVQDALAAIQQIYADHKAENAFVGIGKKYSIGAVKATAIANIGKLKQRAKDATGRSKEDTYGQAVSHWVTGTDNMETIVRKIEGTTGDKSALRTVMVEDLRTGENTTNARMQDVNKAMEAAAVKAGYQNLTVAKIKNGMLGESNTERVPVKIGGKRMELTRGEMMELAAHATDPDTRNLMANGLPFNFRDRPLDPPFTPTLAEVAALPLTKQERAAIQAIKDIHESTRAEFFAAHREIFGNEPLAIKDRYPRKRNMCLSGKAAENAADALGIKGKAFGLTSALGSSITRMEDKKTPVILGDIWQTTEDAMHEVLTFAHQAVPVRNAVAVMNDPAVKQAIASAHGEKMHTRAIKMLQAFSGIENDLTPMGKLVQWLNGARAAALITLNPNSALLQQGGIGRLGQYYSPAEVFAAMPAYVKMSNEEVTRDSGYFAERVHGNAAARIAGVIKASGKDGEYRQSMKAAWVALKKLGLRDSWRSFQNGFRSINLLSRAEIGICKVALQVELTRVSSEKGTAAEKRARAVRRAEDVIRATQNPSSKLDATYANLASRNTGGAAFTFLASDTMTQANRRKMAYMDGGKWAALRMLASEAPSIALSVALRKAGFNTLIALAAAALAGNDDEYLRILRQMQQGIGHAVAGQSIGLILPLGGSALVDLAAKATDGNAATGFDASRDVPAPSIDFVLSSATTTFRAAEAFLAAARIQDDPKKAAKEKAAAWREAKALLLDVAGPMLGNPLTPFAGYAKRAAEAATAEAGDTPARHRQLLQDAAEVAANPAKAGTIIRPIVTGSTGQQKASIRDSLIRNGATREQAIAAIQAASVSK